MNYFEKANELYNIKDYNKAISLYKKAIQNKENEACSFYNTAVCLIKLKNYNESIKYLKEAVKLKKESKYFFNLAYCYAMLNNSKKALIYFKTAWSFNNDDTDCEKAINFIMNNYRKKLS